MSHNQDAHRDKKNAINHVTLLPDMVNELVTNVYATDSYVANFDATVNKMCIQFNVSKNILHIFVDYMNATNFWTRF